MILPRKQLIPRKYLIRENIFFGKDPRKYQSYILLLYYKKQTNIDFPNHQQADN